MHCPDSAKWGCCVHVRDPRGGPRVNTHYCPLKCDFIFGLHKGLCPRLLFRLFKGKHKQNSEVNSFMKQEACQYLHHNHKCKYCIFDFGMFWLIFIPRRPEMRQQLRGLFCTGEQVTVRLPVCFNVLGFFFGGSTLLNINNGTDKPCCFMYLVHSLC